MRQYNQSESSNFCCIRQQKNMNSINMQLVETFKAISIPHKNISQDDLIWFKKMQKMYSGKYLKI
jgi:hypothetical protein